MTKQTGHPVPKPAGKLAGKNQQVKNLPVQDSYVETAVANPERVDNGCAIYKRGA